MSGYRIVCEAQRIIEKRESKRIGVIVRGDRQRFGEIVRLEQGYIEFKPDKEQHITLISTDEIVVINIPVEIKP